MGDAELMAAAFLLDIALYHLGPVRQVYSDPATHVRFRSRSMAKPGARRRAPSMRFYNRRLAALARRKIAAGVYGARNAGWRLLPGGFLPDASVLRLLRRGLGRWLLAEWRNLFLTPLATAASAPALAPSRPTTV